MGVVETETREASVEYCTPDNRFVDGVGECVCVYFSVCAVLQGGGRQPSLNRFQRGELEFLLWEILMQGAHFLFRVMARLL